MSTSPTLLLVEDNDDDVFIFRRAFKLAQLPHALQVATDGQAAVDYLFGRGEFADRAKFPVPERVLLDLKLPLFHGLDVLDQIRASPELSGLKVIVLTSSAEPRDVARARELGAQAYLVKPPTAALLRAAVASEQSDKRMSIPGDLFAEDGTS